MSPEAQIAIMLGMFVFGAAAGVVSRWGPLSAWAALAFPVVLPPLSIGIMMSFC
jgi:hypothetical protein